MGRKRKPGQRTIEGEAPPVEQIGAFTFEQLTERGQVIGKVYRRKPMIDVLKGKGVISEREWTALHHYRHHADIANRSLIRDSLNRQIRGGNGDPTKKLMNALQIVRDCESAVGTLLDILRAVVVDDVSLSQWAIAKAGAVEQRRERAGKTVVSIEPRQKALAIARLEIKMAAGRVEAELAA